MFSIIFFPPGANALLKRFSNFETLTKNIVDTRLWLCQGHTINILEILCVNDKPNSSLCDLDIRILLGISVSEPLYFCRWAK